MTLGFQHTLRWVQSTRALAIVSTCISVVMFSFILDLRYQNRQELIKNIQTAAPGAYKFQQRSGFGSMALFGLALSLVWNGLCLLDLCIKQHYRFERRICIFLDMVVAMVLLVTGFLNFAYDSVLYFDLDTAPQSQVILECAAVAFLGMSCLFHLGFFCHGCKDSGSSTKSDEFDRIPLQPAHSVLAENAYTNPRQLHPAGPTFANEAGLFEVDLNRKFEFVEVQHHQYTDGTMRSPAIRFEQPADPRVLYGAPTTGTRSGLLSTPKPGEGSPFLGEQHGREWI